MAPATTDYLFFVKGEGGGHRFSRSLAEHNRAVAEYRRLERARARQAPSGRSGQ